MFWPNTYMYLCIEASRGEGARHRIHVHVLSNTDLQLQSKVSLLSFGYFLPNGREVLDGLGEHTVTTVEEEDTDTGEIEKHRQR